MERLDTEFERGPHRYTLVERAGALAIVRRVHLTKANVHYEAGEILVDGERELWPEDLHPYGNPSDAVERFPRLVSAAAEARATPQDTGAKRDISCVIRSWDSWAAQPEKKS